MRKESVNIKGIITQERKKISRLGKRLGKGYGRIKRNENFNIIGPEIDLHLFEGVESFKKIRNGW